MSLRSGNPSDSFLAARCRFRDSWLACLWRSRYHGECQFEILPLFMEQCMGLIILDTAGGTYQLKHGKFEDRLSCFCALQWDPNHLYFMVDGITYHTVGGTPVFRDPSRLRFTDHPFSVILSLPIGGTWPRNSPPLLPLFPQKMLANLIRKNLYPLEKPFNFGCASSQLEVPPAVTEI